MKWFQVVMVVALWLFIAAMIIAIGMECGAASNGCRLSI